ncbi:MAG: family oxidoreductase [Rhizobacter sp.]|nr:family oxidoreductase [Rhizobacter sp.]
MGRLDGKVIALAAGVAVSGARRPAGWPSKGAEVAIGDLDVEDATAIADEIDAVGERRSRSPSTWATTTRSGIWSPSRCRLTGGLDGMLLNAAQRSLLSRDTTVVDIDIDIDLDDWDENFRISLKGGVHAARHAILVLVKRGGSLIMTSSVAAFCGEPVRVAYAAAKSGLHAIARHVASAWGKDGIRANCVAPGTVLTPHNLKAVPEEDRQQRLANSRSNRLGMTGDIAALVTHLMSDDGSYIQGQVISVDGGSLFRCP